MRIALPGLNFSQLQQANRDAIGQFVREHANYLQGKVLDFGCGKQPYKDLVRGEYVPFDPGYDSNEDFEIPGAGYDALLVTQVLQFTSEPKETLASLRDALKDGGHLVMTYHSSWYEAQKQDTWRISKEGMERLLDGMNIIVHQPITVLGFDGFDMKLTYGVVARK